MLFEVDHVGVAVPDLEEGRSRFSRLGFLLTARSVHSGSRHPGGPVEPWGSGNHCAMFRQGYLEVIGLIDKELYSSVKDMLALYHGAHIVAIGCRAPADDVYRAMREREIPVTAPRALERDAAFGVGDRQTRRVRFKNAIIPREQFPEARFQYIEHLTRDVMWQPHLLEHPNGVIALAEIWFASDEPAVTSARLGPLFARSAEKDTDGSFRVGLDNAGEVRIVSGAAWRSQMPGVSMPPLPAPVAIGFRVRSAQATRRFLSAAGARVTDISAGRFAVRADEACGVTLIFSEVTGASE